MTTRTPERRRRLAPLALPAAVLGALAGSLASPAPSAVAATPALHDRAASGARVVPLQAPVPPDTYTVVEGDTVYDVARRFGLRTADVLAWSGLTPASVIRPGDTLRLVGAPSTPAPAAPSPAPSSTHTVAPGDTLFAIAAAHGTPLDALLAANGLDRSSVIYPGQTLVLTAGSAPAAAAPAIPAPAAPSPAPAAGVHTVAAGETLFAIALAHGTSLDALLAANGLDRASIIYPGQALHLPGAPGAAAPPSAPAAAATPTTQLSADLSAEQAANAALIIRVGAELGVPDRGIAIALATAMVESGLRNVTWGDRDSLGLFQQRPSTGWGSAEQVQDAERAARAFYGGPNDPNGSTTRGLLDIPGWQDMPFTQAAQAVQISAYPDRYGQWETAAHRWLELHR